MNAKCLFGSHTWQYKRGTYGIFKCARCGKAVIGGQQTEDVARQLLAAGQTETVLDALEGGLDDCRLMVLLAERPEVCSQVNQRTLKCSDNARNCYAQILAKIGDEDSVDVLAQCLAFAWGPGHSAGTGMWCNTVRQALDALCLKLPGRFIALTLATRGNQRKAVSLPLVSAYKSLAESVKVDAARAIRVALTDDRARSSVENQMHCSQIELADLLARYSGPLAARSGQ
jgi:hypothetical protein